MAFVRLVSQRGGGVLQQPFAVFTTPLARASSGAMREQLDRWKKAHELFHHSDRDKENFPDLKNPTFSPAVRMGIFPERWFTAMYDKTGATGPYVLGGALAITLISKEVWVLNHHFAHFLSFWLLAGIVQLKYGDKIARFFDKDVDARDDALLYKPIRDAKQAVADGAEELRTVIKQNETKLMVTDIKQENLALQLEALYRKRLDEVHRSVKKRLDYQVDLQRTEERFRREYMVDWIIQGVEDSITPDHEKQAISSCISRLKELSKLSASG